MVQCINCVYDLQMPNGEMDLSSLCGSISENFSPSSRDDITTSICFVFLLHLANEKVSLLHSYYVLHKYTYMYNIQCST